MQSRVAIIGTGPTGIYTLAGLVEHAVPMTISIFEVETEPGKGTPYHPDANDRTMLANIASIELPPITQSLTQWLSGLSDQELFRMGIARAAISEREFYPRVVIGEFLQSQFRALVELGTANGHTIVVRPGHRVIDIRLKDADIALIAETLAGERKDYAFDHVVMATGHNWPDRTEVKPGYFISPWPAGDLKVIAPGPVGILGTSLSAIDALMTVSTAHGIFYRDAAGQLQYAPSAGSEALQVTIMSRKGLLPEADFYCEYPNRPLAICKPEAVDHAIAAGPSRLLDRAFDLFARELAACDPEYAAHIALSSLNADTFAEAYFADRDTSEPFASAARNLAEAEYNKRNKITIEWRYAILRMHEVVAKVVPHLDEDDLKRFGRGLKTIFIDDYATVPHLSIERMLALHRAGTLSILRLGPDYKLDTDSVDVGARISIGDEHHDYAAFIDATGQSALSARDLPFPSLLSQGAVRPARTPISSDQVDPTYKATGGIELDSCFRPVVSAPMCTNLYCAAIPFLLHKMPFVQGITSAKEIGDIVSQAIRGEATELKKTLILESP